ncbi:UNVERIFIED_CONTAM: Flavanone 7-O-glucoside 2''-O-beta-L-rhamnosyltransferase [Sesamum calycinum]|uniref:Flavanone 7-O-glucoside 2''-O-beta-L-rhamnosyltransferase n=1 Tax=Sesamum calycinum TaxID=2727403 RepID=A0AAW2QKG6_9LAMI
MFPWLAYGHIFPYLELSKRLLIRKNFYIYLCSTPINFTSINTFIRNNNLSESIEVVQLHLQPSHELPPHYHTTKNLPSHLAFTLIKAFQTAKSSFSDIITTLKPDLIMYDGFQPWAARLASSQGIPAVYFTPLGAATVSYAYNKCVCGDDSDFPFQELCLKDDERKTLDDLLQFMSYNMLTKDDERGEVFRHDGMAKFALGEKEISVEDALPKGFLERSSLNESLYFGVPVIGMPMKLTMFIDCKMLAEAGAAMEVVRDKNGAYKGEEIAKAKKKVVVETSGEGLRQRARELSNMMKMQEDQELDEVAEDLWRLCLKSKD